VSIERRHPLDLGDAETGDFGNMLRRVLHDKGIQIVEAAGVLRNIVTIDQAVADEDVGDAVDERDVAAWLDREVDVGHHRGLSDPRVDDDERAVLVAFQTVAEDGMSVGNVGADEQNDISGL
jgi:hypothetical protein